MASRTNRSRRPVALVVLAATIGVAIGLGVALLRSSHAPAAGDPSSSLQAQATWPAGARLAPQIALRDDAGKTLRLSSLRGHVVLLTFLDSRCKRECPVEGRTLGDLQRRIGGTGAVLVVVSVDPWADTVRSVHEFASRAGWRESWHWLLGRKSQLRPVWQSYDIAVKRTPADVLHGTALYVIDRRGDVRSGYLFPFGADAVAREVQMLSSE
jgi:protein SCO1/2